MTIFFLVLLQKVVADTQRTHKNRIISTHGAADAEALHIKKNKRAKRLCYKYIFVL